MVKKATSCSIFNGTDEIVSSVLGLGPGKTLKQKSTCRRLAPGSLSTSDFVAMVSDLYNRMENNLTDRIPSRENWRIERQTYIGSGNRSPEVLLERAIALLGERKVLKDWFNQIPVASGLINETADRRAAIDLLRYRNERVELVELKWESDTPAYAAIEILRYGLIYLLSYVNRDAFGYADNPLMGTGLVSLRVLAPQKFFDDCNLTWLRCGLDEGIHAFVDRKTDQALSMDFGFLAFPAAFNMPFTTGEDVLRMRNVNKDTEPCRKLVAAMNNLESPWCDPKDKAL